MTVEEIIELLERAATLFEQLQVRKQIEQILEEQEVEL